MIRVGLVGFGMGARVFHAPLISSVEGLELAAVVERHGNQAAERYPGIVTYRSLEAMLDDDSLGLFVVATPSGTHFDVARKILEAGRSVVVDKPVAVTSDEIATLIELAHKHRALFIPFHNRRWDGDYLTLSRLLSEGTLGRLVHLESTFDRWRPVPKAGAWKEDPAQGGGMLLDIGTHLADQALCLFGKPQAVMADVTRERDGDGSNDSFSMSLRYQGLMVTLAANVLSSLPRPRYFARGTKGNYSKLGLDPQEAALNRITRIDVTAADDLAWGHEAQQHWGTLVVDEGGVLVTRAVQTIAGDYRKYYAAVRDALLGDGPPPVDGLSAWRVARLLEWAAESSATRCEVRCNWNVEGSS
jgi:scyllo-inositol 2-dehydrogenase (NADP+)